jgi:pimeloyl-ACP methyl ester carboxylesterase
VYIAALAPTDGETVADVFYRAKPHPEAPPMQPDSHGLVWMPEGAFACGIAHRASADEVAILQAVQRPIALRCVQEKAPVPGWKTRPSWFLIAEQDRMIAPETQRFMAERMGATIRAHDVDHSPMYTAPQVAMDVILEAARATLRS